MEMVDREADGSDSLEVSLPMTLSWDANDRGSCSCTLLRAELDLVLALSS